MTLDLSPLTHLVPSDWCRWHELGCKEGREIPCVSTRLQTAGRGSHSGGLRGEQIVKQFFDVFEMQILFKQEKILKVFGNLVLVKITL